MPLAELAERIVQYAEEADQRIIEAGKLICLARERVETELAGETTWTEWAREHIKLSESRRRDLQRVADADDPRQELERIKEMTRKRVEKHREKQKAEEAVSLRSSSDKSVKAPANPESGQQVPSEADSEPGDGHLEERTSEPSLRNDGEVAGATAPEGPDCRERLIRWAADAPLEEIEKVWAFVRSQEPAASGSNPKELAAPAAA